MLEYKRMSKDVTVEGSILHLIEPLHNDVLQAEQLAKEVSPLSGALFTNSHVRDTFLATFMIESWKGPDGKPVLKDEYEAGLRGKFPSTIVERVITECKQLLFEADNARNLSVPTTKPAQKTA
jgi:hypothetical protein